MDLVGHPDIAIQRLTIGAERAPLLLIDNLVADADQLVELAARKMYGDDGTHFPGIRAKAPLSYQRFVLDRLGALFGEVFGLQAGKLAFTTCHFSLVTTPQEKISPLQCIPHIDSAFGRELAFIHYLFKRDLGGTAFYRHRHTGFEVITEEREAEYYRCVAAEMNGPNRPPRRYIDASTALFEQVRSEAGVFNRMLVYRRNSLHCGVFVLPQAIDPNPRTGRLSLNGFLE